MLKRKVFFRQRGRTEGCNVVTQEATPKKDSPADAPLMTTEEGLQTTDNKIPQKHRFFEPPKDDLKTLQHSCNN